MSAQLLLDFFKPPSVQKAETSLNDCKLQRSKRKSLSLHVLPDQTVLIKAPLKMSKRVIEAFVEKHAQWIEQRKQQVRKHSYMFDLKAYENEKIPIFGEPYYLKLKKDSKTSLSIEDSKIAFTYSNKISLENRALYLNKALQEFSLKEFLPYFKSYFDHFQTFYAVEKPQISVKSMKRQWGNYSKQKHAITLNQKLIHLPELCLKSVILHELCHTKYFSHGPRFYQLMDKVMPDWKKADQILRNLE